MTSNNNLADLVPEYLKPLAPLEEKLLKAAPFGSEVSDFEPDEPIDKNQLGEVQSIRSELLIWLLTDSAARVMIHHKGINLRGAKVAGILDLEDSSIDYPLRLRECVIEEEMILARGDYKLLDFSGCQTGSIDADSIHVQYDVLMMGGFKAKGEVRLRGADIGGNLRCDGGEFENPKGYAFYGDNLKTNGNVFLRAGFKTKGEARLLGASIGGNLECDGGELENPRGYALSADNLTAKGNVFLRSGFKTKGGVRFPRAEIGGSFECDGAELENPGGYALHGDGLTTKGSLFLRNGFKAKGEVRLRAATLGGNLECSGGEFEDPKGHALFADNLSTKGNILFRNGFKAKGQVLLVGADIGGTLECDGGEFENPDGYALIGDRLITRGSVFICDGFKAKGQVRVLGASIGGDLWCDGGEIENPEGPALSANNLTTKGSIFMSDGFKAKGEVHLVGASIGGSLRCDGGAFENPDAYALIGDGLTTKGSIFMSDGFRAKGEVHLVGADIGGSLECDAGQFENPNGNALTGDSLTIRGSLFMRDGFKAKGEVQLTGAAIGGSLECDGGQFESPEGYAFRGDQMKVTGFFFWSNMTAKPIGKLNLVNARLSQLIDDENSWPESGNLYMDGLTYGPFVSGVPADSKSRLQWLNLRNPHHLSVQPYEQLIHVFRQMGLQDDAREVAIAKRKAIHKRLKGLPRIWSWILGTTIDYGYRPQKVVLMFILPILVLGILVFRWAFSIGVMEPTNNRQALQSGQTVSSVTPSLFDPVAYSVDVFLPIVDLHQEDAWQPNTAIVNGIYIQYYMYFHILAGWFFTTLAVAAVTGLVRSD